MAGWPESSDLPNLLANQSLSHRRLHSGDHSHPLRSCGNWDSPTSSTPSAEGPHNAGIRRSNITDNVTIAQKRKWTPGQNHRALRTCQQFTIRRTVDALGRPRAIPFSRSKWIDVAARRRYGGPTWPPNAFALVRLSGEILENGHAPLCIWQQSILFGC